MSKARIARCRKENLCVACLDALDGEVIRGCHSRCYRATLRAIAKGVTTDQKQVKQGKLLPRAKPGRKVTNPVSLEFEATLAHGKTVLGN